MENNYTYRPDIPEVFRCRVPLPDTMQSFVVNGVLMESFGADGVEVVKSDAGYNLTVKDGVVMEKGLQIVSFRDSSDIEEKSIFANYDFGKDSVSDVLLCTHTLSLDKFKTNAKVAINMQERANASIVLMQNEHNSSDHSVEFSIELAKESTLKLTIVTLHGAAITNTMNVNLNGKGAVCELNGIYLVDGKQEIKTHVHMNHKVPDCYSSQLFKGVLDNESRALFFGKINVFKDAQKTQAYQANHNLLLSQKAKVYAQPQLEIYADDVKCSHGATSGRLDEMALFYMRSRGIGMEEAKILQQQAFVNDVLEKISKAQLRSRLEELVERRLRGEFSHCNNCSLNCC